MDYKKLGDFGERLACEYLVNKGYKILGKNWKNSFGEIDIIVIKNGLFLEKTVHFVEVKTSFVGNNNFYPEQRVDWKKQNKYKRLAEFWLEQNKYPQNIPYQIDIISILVDNIKQKAQIKVFENIVNE